jgi:gliding motility-associated-like protein
VIGEVWLNRDIIWLFGKELIFLEQLKVQKIMGFFRFFPPVLPWLVLFLPGFTSLTAQITASSYASVMQGEYSIVYPDTTIKDNIYIYCSENWNLSAFLEGGEGDLAFEWSAYDPSFPGFGLPFTTSSSISNLESGGYQVRIRDGNGTDTLFRAWVFVNRPGAGANVIRHDCQVIDLSGNATIEPFVYYDPENNQEYIISADYEFAWSADPFVPVSSSRTDPRVWNPPPVKTDYTFTVTYFSCQASSTISEEPVTTRAEFVIDPAEGEAPLEVAFNAALSLNALEYQWFFDYRPEEDEAPPPDDSTGTSSHVYYIPGEYTVKLKTINGLCEDELIFAQPVRVLPSELEVPNVFSPDDTGYNDVFMVRAVSMRDFHAVIYNRYGKKVYESRDPLEGWDGEKGKASSGVYYYLITGTGWDDKEYEFTGPLHLFKSR